MSLDRAALRLATVMAITNGYKEPFPTIAGANVFDSRVDPLSGGTIGDIAPLATLFTDDDEGEALSANNGGPPFRQYTTLVFELSIGMVGELTDNDGNALSGDDGKPLLGLLPVATEPEMELMLDLFEWQIGDVFRRPQVSRWATRLWDKHIVRIERWDSRRFVEREGQKRLAVRQIMAKVMLPQQEWPETDRIPEPLGSLLEEVASAGGHYAQSAAAMHDLLNDYGGFGPLDLPALKSVHFTERNLGGGASVPGSANAPEFARPHGVGEAKPLTD